MDEVFHVSDLDQVLQERGITHIHTLYGQNHDSDLWTRHEASFPGIEKYSKINNQLHDLLSELRVFKNSKEIQLMRTACLVTSQAHVHAMRHVQIGMRERHAEALFRSWTGYYGGSRHNAYTCICGTGPNGAILHYGHAARPNDCDLKAGDMLLLDMGAEYNGYATDITRTFPVSGKFTADQRAIFNAVRAAQEAVFAAMRPGVSWPDMHRIAERIILTHLLRLGVVYNGTVDEMIASHVASVFMPHGLGHLLGLYVHDVGGYGKGCPERGQSPGVCWLRTSRVLRAGMVITVEPGIYFNQPTIDKGMKNPAQAKFINAEVLKRFRNFGGVRLEDDVLITEHGIENFTVLPSTPDEIEEVIALARRHHGHGHGHGAHHAPSPAVVKSPAAAEADDWFWFK